MPKLKAAAVSFLNAWPLTEGLDRSDRIELVLAEPSRCAAMLEAGDREAFAAEFRKVAEWFGPFGEQAMRESSYLIEKMIERF